MCSHIEYMFFCFFVSFLVIASRDGSIGDEEYSSQSRPIPLPMHQNLCTDSIHLYISYSRCNSPMYTRASALTAAIPTLATDDSIYTRASRTESSHPYSIHQRTPHTQTHTKLRSCAHIFLLPLQYEDKEMD